LVLSRSSNTRIKQKRKLRTDYSSRGSFMSEKKPSAEEVLQKIDQLLVVLKDIAQDLEDISKSLKTAGPQLSTTTPSSALSMPPTPAEQLRSVKDVRTLFPKELEDMLNFEETPKYIIIKPRQYLGSENFAKIASLVRSTGGEYISAGKESHFRVSRELK
jgi:hypothetical protein